MVARFVVRGMVQGVGYRFFARRTAAGLGLDGFVRNRSDGTVEAVARGSAGSLAAFESALRRGPSMARVAGVDRADISDEGELPNGFEIK